ncbi:peptidylprolyl isomerase [Dokdonia sinensis]|uniref:peptidylprolyl isomerase n=1 Tax=Dokdonia sinensis TaxID=2479847 RepID=A0A3M0G5Z6_9FLAO|nr:peptidylprolyl isomerase [Dokdonia sinensis]RMB60461.1 peptidylprolyl isomerase [Dokdonia sinensis]
MRKLPMYLFIALLTLLSCNDKYPDLEDGLYAEIVTDKGTMVAQLYFEETPATVANFVALAEGNHPMVKDSTLKGKPFYNGLTFHRVIEDFMIQGGDPLGKGSGDAGYKFHDEFVDGLVHDSKGTLSMANSGPDTNSSQFFITQKETPWLNGRHTVWGKVVIGLEVIDDIIAVEKIGDPRQGKPKVPPVMTQVNIIRKGSAAKNFNAPETFKAELAGIDAKRVKAAEEKAAADAIKYKEYKERFDSKREKAEKLPSGLAIFIDEKTDGEKPALGAKVKVDYAGFFESGELFDTSQRELAEKLDKVNPRSPYQPMNVPYSNEARLIAGMKEGIQQLKVGEKATIFVPYHLGYGEQEYGPIPAKSNMIFEIELLEIVK